MRGSQDCGPGSPDPSRLASEGGFSLVDIMIAISILMIGVIALLGTMTIGLVTTGRGQQQLIAKQYVTSTMESIFSARDLNNPNITSFGVIANDTTTGGLFLSGKQPIYNSTGNDGIIGTKDDGWGSDGIKGTPDDLTSVTGMQREIKITQVETGLIQVTVTVYFQVSGFIFQESLSSYMANYNTQSV
ncbi:MAG TPA: hypothetical protein VN345_03160 [Blastocatellia bacterium]|nr:hypothetical protein [Blastocatellia bacterium]